MRGSPLKKLVSNKPNAGTTYRSTITAAPLRVHIFRRNPSTASKTPWIPTANAWVRMFEVLVEQGVHLAPSPFEAWFISTAHDTEALDHVIAAARLAMQA